MDRDKGEIYIARNKITGKAYVGQAQKLMGVAEQKWGGKGRWTRHRLESTLEDASSYQNLVSEAIRTHGFESFELKIICECLLDEMDELEERYIAEYNTLEPNGYNMTTGGKKGKHSQLANERKMVRRTDFSDKARDNMSKGQVGKRYQAKSRKYPEDSDLPKNVKAIRQDEVIIGYSVHKFPMGIEVKEYVYKTFRNKSNPEEALLKATTYVKMLQKQYEQKLADYHNNNT